LKQTINVQYSTRLRKGFGAAGIRLSTPLPIDQLLKLRIVAQWIPDRVDAQQCWGQWSERQPAKVMGIEKFGQSGYCTSCFTGLRFDDRERFLGGSSVVGVITF